MKEGELRKLLREVDIKVVHKNAAGWLICSCPFSPWLHQFGQDRNPSFNVHVNAEGYSGYSCFSCHQKGNLTSLLNRLGGYRGEDYSKLIIRSLLAETPDSFEDWDDAGKAPLELSPLDAELYLRMYPLAWEDRESRAYLDRRGILKSTAELLGLRFDPDEKRILFPVMDAKSNLFGFTGRTILPRLNDRYPKVRDYAGLRKDHCLLGEHLFQAGKPVLLVEGLFALANMIEIGVRDFCNPLASMGSYLSDYQAGILEDLGERVYLLYDDDKAGEEGLFGEKGKGGGAVDKLREVVPTFVCLYPDGVYDPDDLELDEVREMVEGEENELASGGKKR